MIILVVSDGEKQDYNVGLIFFCGVLISITFSAHLPSRNTISAAPNGITTKVRSNLVIDSMLLRKQRSMASENQVLIVRDISKKHLWGPTLYPDYM